MTLPHRAFAPRAVLSLVAALLPSFVLACKSGRTSTPAEAGAGPAVASAGGGAAGSCRVYKPASHVLATCIDYVGSEYDAGNVPSVCTTNVRSGPSEYSASACPAAARVGSCLVNAGTAVATVLRSYPPAEATAKTLCAEAGGTWTPR